MKVITNPTDNKINVGFEGWNYILEEKEKALCEDTVAQFLFERYPWLEVSETPKVKGPSPIKFIEKKKTITNSRIKSGVDMVITPNEHTAILSETDGLPMSGSIDRDGIEWIGEGIEVDKNLTSSGSFR